MRRFFLFSVSLFLSLFVFGIHFLHSQSCVYCTGSVLNSSTASSIGASNVLSGEYSAAIGRFLGATASQSIVIGSGHSSRLLLENNMENSLMIGFGSPHPTIFVSPSTYNTSGGKYALGRVGIHTTAPQAHFHVNGDFQVGEVISSLQPSTTHDVPAKVRLYNSISALGLSSVSDSAVSFGRGNQSSGLFSFVSGSNSVSSGDYSVAMGYEAKSTGHSSISLGFFTEAQTPASVSLGRFVKATASNAVVIGGGYDANGYLVNNKAGSLMVGFYSSNPTFFVGSSPGSGNRTGSVGIGNVTSPMAKLHIRADSQEAATLRLEATGTGTNALSIIYLTSGHAIRAATNQHFYFSTPANNRHFIFENGNVGIGIANPTSKLHVSGNVNFENGNVGIGIDNPASKLDVSGNVNASGTLTVGSSVIFNQLKGAEPKMLVVNTNGTLSSEAIPESSDFSHVATQNIDMNGYQLVNGSGSTSGIYIATGGRVGIGTTAPGNYRLAVKGGITAESVKIVMNVPASDFVFDPDYELMPLDVLETFVADHRHLPEIPSAAQFAEEGYDIGSLDDLMLRKIEELTLYIIQQQKEIDALKLLLNQNR